MSLRRTARACSLAALSLLTWQGKGLALGQSKYVEFVRHPNDFAIAEAESLATIYVDANDHAGVVRAVGDLRGRCCPRHWTDAGDYKQRRIQREPDHRRHHREERRYRPAHPGKKIDVSSIAGKWESFLIQVVAKPLPGVSSALVIAGSDKRGTIYGIYDLSEQIGVSPWYWWADVPCQHKMRSS